MFYVILSLCSLSIVVAVLTGARIVAEAVRSTAKPRVEHVKVVDYPRMDEAIKELKFQTGGYVKPAAKDGGTK